MSECLKFLILLAFCHCAKFSISQNKANIKLAIGSTYNYRDFYEPKYKYRNINSLEKSALEKRINTFNNYENILDSLDVPLIAQALGVYYDFKIDTLGSNGFMFRMGLQLGIKQYAIKAKKVYYYSDYKYAKGPVASAIVGLYQHPMWGIPLTSGYKIGSKNKKLQFSLSGGPVINFWLGYSKFKTYKSQQQSIFNYYKPTRDLGYDDFEIADKESHLFFDANLRWQAQLALNYKISRSWMIGLFCWWEDTVFQRKNGGRVFYRKDTNMEYSVAYRRRFYSGNVSIALTRILK